MVLQDMQLGFMTYNWGGERGEGGSRRREKREKGKGAGGKGGGEVYRYSNCSLGVACVSV
jgi:hypothetical protein